MSKPLFWAVVRVLEVDSVYANNTVNGLEQEKIHHQVAVTLWRMGQYGNGASLLRAYDLFKLSGESTTADKSFHATRHCMIQL